jgi:hypothetical protein
MGVHEGRHVDKDLSTRSVKQIEGKRGTYFVHAEFFSARV